jgi:hypothetical protein
LLAGRPVGDWGCPDALVGELLDGRGGRGIAGGGDGSDATDALFRR